MRGRADRYAARSSPSGVRTQSDASPSEAATVDLVVTKATFEPFNSASKTTGDNASSTQPKPCVGYIKDTRFRTGNRGRYRAAGGVRPGR
jgi:hypothetical protein